MLVKFDAPILDLEGKEMQEDGKTVTLGLIACRALLAQIADEKELPADKKIQRYRLALTASDGGEKEVKVEDVVELKKLVNTLFGPLVVGRVYDILEPPTA